MLLHNSKYWNHRDVILWKTSSWGGLLHNTRFSSSVFYRHAAQFTGWNWWRNRMKRALKNTAAGQTHTHIFHNLSVCIIAIFIETWRVCVCVREQKCTSSSKVKQNGAHSSKVNTWWHKLMTAWMFSVFKPFCVWTDETFRCHINRRISAGVCGYQVCARARTRACV